MNAARRACRVHYMRSAQLVKVFRVLKDYRDSKVIKVIKVLKDSV